MTSLNFSPKFAALDHLESVRIYITHGLAGRENQMPRPRIPAGAAVFRKAIMDVSVFNHDDIAAIVSQALVARQFLHFPLRPSTPSKATISDIAHSSPLPQPKHRSHTCPTLSDNTGQTRTP